MIETQLAQLASTIKEKQVHTSLPPQGQPPKQLYAILTRSGKTLDDSATYVEAPSSRGESSMGNESSYRDDAEEKSHVNDMSVGDKSKETPLPPLPTPPPPYPQRVNRHKLDVQFSKCLEVLRKFHITLPFMDALKQMPTYSRFLKEILNGKRNCDVKETVNLTENCSAIILNKMPPKLKDPGSFSIPCAIKELEISNTLCDLGASVSIQPYSVFAKLEVGDLVPTNITLQRADRSVKYPIGKVEDVPLVVGELTFLVDFVVLDIYEDAHTPIILGRPFFATTGAFIDVKEGLITLKAGDAKASFKLAIDEHCFSKMKSCMKVDTLACCDFEIDRKVKKDVHESSFVQGDPYDGVITIPDTFGMDLDDEKSLTPASNGKKCMSKESKQGNPMPKRTWFGPHSLSGGLGKWFVPKEAKKGLLTSVDPRFVVFDPP
ncbi:uncharacterized protein [Spinacia oleracea]|uniref:Aspartic peptidase DDI1-type domain-containing protein n=1 Tax=Spinacia oleracea TaxID=3562 RepID=A0ABM3R1T4_SPIOL|nr:uncharacterized protein LOC130464135 [Spinacia oleracea]